MNNILRFDNKYIKSEEVSINNFGHSSNFKKIFNFFTNEHAIDCTLDQDIIQSFTKDWSNLPGGNAELLVRPINAKQCAIILKLSQVLKIPITISAGQTNLTGSATPFGGIILSTTKLNKDSIAVNTNQKYVSTPVGIPLELMRNEILKQSKSKLYYPVDPTSRHDAFVGGTLACNASGFIPGIKGATRYWVREIDFMLINGYVLKIKRGQYFSKKGMFKLVCDKKIINVSVPKYHRPEIKNASGPYSALNEEIDFIDLIIGSEGIFGMITSCKFNLLTKPNNYLKLFLRLDSENMAISFHSYLYDYFDGDLSQITALEYFGYNCQTYMKNSKFLFNNSSEVGVYLQIPVYNDNIDSAINDWVDLLNLFDSSIDLDNIIILNEPSNWKLFFEARHSMPDEALSKTKSLGGISIITDTIVPKNNFKKYLKAIHKKLQIANIEYLLFGHLGDCHLHFHLIPTVDQKEESIRVYNEMIDLSTQLGGVYSAEHGTGKRKRYDFEKCYGKKATKMIKEIKSSFDVDFLLNRGNVVNYLS